MEENKDTKDKGTGIKQLERGKWMNPSIYQQVNSNEIALQLASQIIDDVKEHKTKSKSFRYP